MKNQKQELPKKEKTKFNSGQILKMIGGALVIIVVGIGAFFAYQKFFINQNQPNSPVATQPINNQPTNTSTPMAQKSSTAKLLFRVVDTGEQWKERGVYLADPITKEVTQLTQSPYQFSGLYGKILVFTVKDTNKYYRYDIAKKEYALLNFPILKKEGNTYETLYIDRAPISGEDKILVSVFTYNTNDEISEFYGGRTARGRKDYLFSFSQNSFEEAKNIEQARKLLGDNVNDFSGYGLLGLDEKNRRAFFQLSGEGIGCSDIAIVNVANSTVQKIDDKNFQRGASIGCFYINPNFDRGFYVDSKTNSIVATLVSLSDITKPIYSFNLTNAVDMYDHITNPDINSLEWLNDSTKVVIGFTDKITLLDFKNNKIETIYKDHTLGQSYLYWDRNTIRSDGQTAIAFIDYYSAKYTPCNNPIGCPSSQTADNRYRVIIQSISDNSQEIFLDDVAYKEVIGWVDW